MNNSIVVGRNLVLVRDDEFGNGFQTGYLRFKMDFEGVLLTDNGLYEMLCQSTQDVQNFSRYNAGYVTGWMADCLRGGMIHQ